MHAVGDLCAFFLGIFFVALMQEAKGKDEHTELY